MMIPDVAERAAELEQLCRAHHVRRLDLFGSAAAGRYQSERSDLDFLVDFHPLPFSDYADAYFGLLEALRQLFERPVDLVVRAAIKNPYFLQSVEQTRTCVYEARSQEISV